MGPSRWGNAKISKSPKRGLAHEVGGVLWAKMAARGSHLRARSKQRNRETEKRKGRLEVGSRKLEVGRWKEAAIVAGSGRKDGRPAEPVVQAVA